MKTPKAAAKAEKNAFGTPSGGKITKNKLQVKSKPGGGNKLDAVKAKLGLNKAQDSVQMKDAKALSKKKDSKNKVLNGKLPPQVGSPKTPAGSPPPSSIPNPKGANKKSKPNEAPANVAPTKVEGLANAKKSKKIKEKQSQEVQLGLKIEKLLESPKTASAQGGSKKMNKKKGKGPVAAGGSSQASPATPQVQSPDTGVPGQGKKRKRKGKGNQAQGSPPTSGKPAGKKQKQKGKQTLANQPFVKVDYDAPIKMGSFPNRLNTENAIKALLSEMRDAKSKKPAILDEFEQIFLTVDFFKHPGAKRLQRVVLPNGHLGANPDVVFIATDAKKAKKEPEESIEAHRQLFANSGISIVPEVIPWRKLIHEYTQFEEKRKLCNRGDAFLIDSKLSHRWPAIMRKKFMRRKAPIPLRLEPASELKKHFEVALRKTAIILGPNALCVSPVIGHVNMSVKALVDNLITVVTVLCDETKFPGGQNNIRLINVKGAKTASFPIFLSTVSPNAVDKPKPLPKKKREVVEGEVTTAGVTVAVHPSGVVKIKSKDEDEELELDSSPKKKKIVKKEEEDDDGESESDIEDDDEDDDENDEEIDELLAKYKKANKASDSESTDEEEIEKAEQEFLLALRKQQDAIEAEAEAATNKAKKGKKVAKSFVAKEEQDDDDSEEDDEDLDDDEDDLEDEEDEDSDMPDLIPAKMSKPQGKAGKQQQQQFQKGKNAKAIGGGGKPAQNGLQGKGKPGKQQQSPKGGAPNKKGPQGGKGNPNQKGNKQFNKGSPKPQQRYFNTKAGSKKK